MREETFILFKPDAMKNEYIRSSVLEELEKMELHIYDQKEINIDEESICVLWDFTCRDRISKYAMKIFFENSRLLLLQIEGEDAIEKVHQLKKQIRKKYAVNFYCNCFHAPRTKEEYIHDIAYILHKQRMKSPKTPLIADISCFTKSSCLKETQMEEYAKELFTRINHNGIESMVESQESSKKNYCVYMVNDDKHELVYAAAAICEFVPDVSLTDAYLLSMATDLFGRIIIYSSDNKKRVEEIGEKLISTGLNFEVV